MSSNIRGGKISKPRKLISCLRFAINQESQRKIARFTKYVDKQCDKPKEKSVDTNNTKTML